MSYKEIADSYAEHLGGFVPGGDPATYYPELWTWLVEEFGARSILDVGAGDGVAVDFFKSAFVKFHGEKYGATQAFAATKAVGIDGVKQENSDIKEWDYTKGPYIYPNAHSIITGTWDLIWSCEFVEHVEEQYVGNFLETFKTGKTVLMTHGEPGQQGHHHVNLQTPFYWIKKMREIGYNLDSRLTQQTRFLAVYNKSPYNHYVRSGLAFRRNDGNI